MAYQVHTVTSTNTAVGGRCVLLYEGHTRAATLVIIIAMMASSKRHKSELSFECFWMQHHVSWCIFATFRSVQPSYSEPISTLLGLLDADDAFA
jgi:hypothetical protein